MKRHIVTVSISILLVFVVFSVFYFDKTGSINRVCKITLPKNYITEAYTKNGRYFNAKIRVPHDEAEKIKEQIKKGDYFELDLIEQRSTHEEYTIPWWDLKKTEGTICYVRYDDVYFTPPYGRTPTVTTIYFDESNNEETLIYITYC